MYTLNTASAIINMTVNELKEFIFENCYKVIVKGRSYYFLKHSKKKDLQLFAPKLTEKIRDPSNTKQYYNS